MKYTPGPWQAEKGHEVVAESRTVALMPLTISVGRDMNAENQECAANANLVALAPAMLETLQLVKQFLDAMRVESGVGNVLLPFEKMAFEQVDEAVQAVLERVEETA